MAKRASSDRFGWVLIALLAIFPLCCYPQDTEPATPVPKPAEEQQQLSPSEPAPSDPLEIWLEALAMAESGNRQHLVHRDRDGNLYYGCLQFKESTFRAYVRKFHLLPKVRRPELMSRIYDCRFQKRLAALMIRDDPESWKNWRGTVEKRVGPPPADVTP